MAKWISSSALEIAATPLRKRHRLLRRRFYRSTACLLRSDINDGNRREPVISLSFARRPSAFFESTPMS